VYVVGGVGVFVVGATGDPQVSHSLVQPARAVPTANERTTRTRNLLNMVLLHDPYPPGWGLKIPKTKNRNEFSRYTRVPHH